jgi:hypothetical protein
MARWILFAVEDLIKIKRVYYARGHNDGRGEAWSLIPTVAG